MIDNRAGELDRFKRDINLTAFAASMGFRLDKAKSSRNCAVMTDGKGDKVVITRQPNGHWTYFSVHDDGDNGTIIDFLQRRSGKSLGEVRKALRAWTGAAVDVGLYVRNMGLVERDTAAMLREWNRTWAIDGRQGFLEDRGLAAALADPRFAGTIHTDARGNAIFPHHDAVGTLSGFERRNHGFKGFSAGGAKGLWMSNASPDDTRVVICESPLDCMAYHLLKGDERTRYVATGGAISGEQLRLLDTVLRNRPPKAEVVIASDSDDAGELFARQIAEQITQIVRDRPAAKDWNDVLNTHAPEMRSANPRL